MKVSPKVLAPTQIHGGEAGPTRLRGLRPLLAPALRSSARPARHHLSGLGKAALAVLIGITFLGGANRASAAVTAGASQVQDSIEVSIGTPLTIPLKDPASLVLSLRQGQTDEHPARATVQASLPLKAFGPRLEKELKAEGSSIEARVPAPFGSEMRSSTVKLVRVGANLVLSVPEVDPAAWTRIIPQLELRTKAGETLLIRLVAPKLTVDWTEAQRAPLRIRKEQAEEFLRSLSSNYPDPVSVPRLRASYTAYINKLDHQLHHPDPSWRMIVPTEHVQ